MKNINDEPYQEIQLLQFCLNTVNKIQEHASKKDSNTKYMATYKSSEFS